MLKRLFALLLAFVLQYIFIVFFNLFIIQNLLAEYYKPGLNWGIFENMLFKIFLLTAIAFDILSVIKYQKWTWIISGSIILLAFFLFFGSSDHIAKYGILAFGYIFSFSIPLFLQIRYLGPESFQ